MRDLVFRYSWLDYPRGSVGWRRYRSWRQRGNRSGNFIRVFGDRDAFPFPVGVGHTWVPPDFRDWHDFFCVGDYWRDCLWILLRTSILNITLEQAGDRKPEHAGSVGWRRYRSWRQRGNRSGNFIRVFGDRDAFPFPVGVGHTWVPPDFRDWHDFFCVGDYWRDCLWILLRTSILNITLEQAGDRKPEHALSWLMLRIGIFTLSLRRRSVIRLRCPKRSLIKNGRLHE